METETVKRRGEIKTSVWSRLCLAGSVGILLLTAAATAVVDPFFHYHKPLDGLQYPLREERYQNDGILRHYDYTAVITGTSMAQNFKASQFEELWGEKTVKTVFPGATFKEINDVLERAFSHNPGIRYVVRSLDANMILYDADTNSYENYPEYLYDENPWNDVQYLLNKDMFIKTLRVVRYTLAGDSTTTMDEYSSHEGSYGRDEVIKSVRQLGYFENETYLTEADKAEIAENMEKNFLKLAQANPNVTFYVFFPPYSVYYWKSVASTKQLKASVEIERIATEILLQADNIRIFHFADETDITANLDNYSDSLHYGPWINEKILQWMYEGEHELKRDNYREYFERLEDIYRNFPYEERGL